MGRLPLIQRIDNKVEAVYSDRESSSNKSGLNSLDIIGHIQLLRSLRGPCHICVHRFAQNAYGFPAI